MMKDKIKSFFTKNIGLKLLSLLLGIVIWGILSNAYDPVVSKNIYIPINYMYADNLMKNESLMVLSAPETVQITVKIRNSRQSEDFAKYFTCNADLIDHEGGNLNSQRVRINVEMSEPTELIIDWSYYRNDPNITVSMDEYITKSFNIDLLALDDLSEGLIMPNTISFSPSEVTVSGPKSSFSSLASVRAVVSLLELSENGGGEIEEPVEIKLYDANDNVIPNADSALKLSTDKTTMSAVIYRTQTILVKTEGTVGTPRQGYRFSDMEVSPKSILVYGLKAQLSQLQSIVIPKENIDITDIAKKDAEYAVNLTDYLPEGITLLEGDGTAVVSVKFETLQSEIFELKPSDIRFVHSDSQMIYTLSDTTLKLRVSGFKEELEELNTSLLDPYIDLGGLTEGRQQRVKVYINMLDGYTFTNADLLYVYVNVTKKEEPTTQAPTFTEPETVTGSEDDTESGSESEEPSEASSEEESTAEGSSEPGESEATEHEGTLPEHTVEPTEKPTEEPSIEPERSYGD